MAKPNRAKVRTAPASDEPRFNDERLNASFRQHCRDRVRSVQTAPHAAAELLEYIAASLRNGMDLEPEYREYLADCLDRLLGAGKKHDQDPLRAFNLRHHGAGNKRKEDEHLAIACAFQDRKLPSVSNAEAARQTIKDCKLSITARQVVNIYNENKEFAEAVERIRRIGNYEED